MRTVSKQSNVVRREHVRSTVAAGSLISPLYSDEVKEMLVLSRKEGERLCIGNDVTITVNRISGNRITLGIDAPRDVRIVRGELELEPPTSDRDGGSAEGSAQMRLEAEYRSN